MTATTMPAIANSNSNSSTNGFGFKLKRILRLNRIQKKSRKTHTPKKNRHMPNALYNRFQESIERKSEALDLYAI